MKTTLHRTEYTVVYENRGGYISINGDVVSRSRSKLLLKIEFRYMTRKTVKALLWLKKMGVLQHPQGEK